MYSYCIQSTSRLSLSDISDIAQVIIAVANLSLAAYLLLYKINKDKKDANETARLNEQNIKLQWFKELIVEPNYNVINAFYINLHTLKSRINSNDLTIEEKEDINNFVKKELSIMRKSFIDAIYAIDKDFADQIIINLDELVDGITNSIFDDELKLMRDTVYEKNIGSKISSSRNNLIKQLYNYKGISK